MWLILFHVLYTAFSFILDFYKILTSNKRICSSHVNKPSVVDFCYAAFFFSKKVRVWIFLASHLHTFAEGPHIELLETETKQIINQTGFPGTC